MPSLTDTLAVLSHQSQQITELSSRNIAPAGPFVQALLYTASVLSLIRDAQDSEARLFKFIGEEYGGKKVEKKDGTVLTPLKELKRGKVGGDQSEQVAVMLRTALRLVDDYRPMPRARSHIKDLLRAHQQQLDRIDELERLIEEAKVTTTATPVEAQPPPLPTPKAKRDPDAAIKAEEEALRALEASLAPMREAANRSRSASPEKPPSPSYEPRPSIFRQTPAKSQIIMPHISNSLVNGTTPRRHLANPPINRFSPLTLLGTPSTKSKRHSIFGLGRRSSLRKTSRSKDSRTLSPEKEVLEEQEGDETIRLTAPVPAEPPSPEKPATPGPSIAHSDGSPKPSPFKTPAPHLSNRVEGIDVDSEKVMTGVARVESTMGEIFRQGVRSDSDPPNTIDEKVRHIYRLSQSDPDAPPTPSSSSSASIQTGPPPITKETILAAHLLLLILRAEDGSAGMNDVKERLATIAKARGWEGAEEIGVRVVYATMGRRCVKIDRRGAGGGRILFAT